VKGWKVKHIYDLKLSVKYLRHWIHEIVSTEFDQRCVCTAKWVGMVFDTESYIVTWSRILRLISWTASCDANWNMQKNKVWATELFITIVFTLLHSPALRLRP
jgi:hypothetical protein